MKIARSTVVILTYALRRDHAEGELLEEISAEKPLRFLFGAGVMLPDFEINIYGKQADDTFEFVVHKERGYGRFRDEAVVHVPIGAFEVDGKIPEGVLKPGTTIPMKDKHGKPMNGRIVEVGEEKVKIDFNHNLAGSHLHFSGKIVSVREASMDEVKTGKALG